jgi:hypothetical protein
MSDYEVKRQRIRGIVRTIYDYQDIRIKMGNRLRFKKNGEDQNDSGAEMVVNPDGIPYLVDAFNDSKEIEEALVKSLKIELNGIRIYDEFLKYVKGIGPMMAGVIIAEYDIYKAHTISAMNQYTGLNPGLVPGKKRIGNDLVVTDTMIRGDKLTPGFVAPFNTRLRSKMIGVLGSSFLKSKSPYAKFYYDYKNRLKNEDRVIEGRDKRWSETSDLHRHNAAIRFMVKAFIKDLYVAWRTAEGLTVRCPYEEEYLGKKHHYYEGEIA